MKKVIIGLIIFSVISLGVLYGLYKYKNLPPRPDYFEHYMAQDTMPSGKVGIFVIGLIMPAEHDPVFFNNIVQKVFKTIIPWPFRLFATIDRGVALLDPVRYYERNEFTPTALEDMHGNDRDIDEIPYIEKYKKGEIEWVPPSKQIHLDHGYFVYKGRKGGLPTVSGKIINKMRIWYYDKAIAEKKLPHWDQTFAVINGALDKISKKYDTIDFRTASNPYQYEVRQRLFELLDAGCDTIVLSSVLTIYSHFEDFNFGFRQCFEYIDEWEQNNPGKKIKVIMAPPMSQFQPMRQAFLEMLKDRLDIIPRGKDVTVALTVHGMPWDILDWEAWLKFAPPYRDKLYEEVVKLLESYNFGRKHVVTCQDEFADPVWNPENKYLSTNRAYWNAINDSYDYVINLPIEFYSESTDTLFHHTLKQYENFDNYDPYDQISYPDWSVPYTREIIQGKTRVIYNGVPVGRYQEYVIEALYMAIDSILKNQNSFLITNKIDGEKGVNKVQ